MKASEDPLLHSYGNWLACIAGSMASLAFVVAWLLGKCWKFRDVAFAMKCLQRSYPNHIGMKMHSHPDLGFQGMCFGKPGCWLFKVEESAIDDTIVKELCDQILDQPLDMLGLFGRYCCVAWQIDILFIITNDTVIMRILNTTIYYMAMILIVRVFLMHK